MFGAIVSRYRFFQKFRFFWTKTFSVFSIKFLFFWFDYESVALLFGDVKMGKISP